MGRMGAGRRLGGSIIGSAIVAAALAPPSAAQAPALPEAMVARFTSNDAALLFPGPTPASAQELSASIRFDTEQRVVELSWLFSSGGSSGAQHETQSVSWSPTAVCVQQGLGPSFYVAGYIPRTGQSIIEKWTVAPLIGATQPAGGGPPLLSLTNSMQKEIVTITDGIGPIRTLIYHFSQARLWAFEETAPHRVWSIDPAAGVAQLAYDTSSLPELPGLLSAQVFKIKPGAPDGGGVLVVLYRWRAWKRLWLFPHELDPADTVWILRDGDGDGTIDESGPISWAQYAARQYDQNMNPYYH